MNMRNGLYFLLFTLLLGCQQNRFSQSEKSIEEIKAEGPLANADIIRNPITAEGPADTVNVAKMSFAETTFNFGQVQEGAVVRHTYRFTNTGKVALVISDARSTCGCTVPTWPTAPIEPGASGEIQVEFNTKNKQHEQKKPITITANTYPARTVVHLEGYVQPAQESQ